MDLQHIYLILSQFQIHFSNLNIYNKKLTNMVKCYSDNFVFKIPVRDSGEKLVSVKKYSKKIIVKQVNIGKIKRKKLMVRETVAKKLAEVQKKLPKDYNLVVYDGHREYKIQKKFFSDHLKRIKKKYPKLKGKKLLTYAAKFVANPDHFAPHTTGGAVDVTLEFKGKEINMGGFKLYISKSVSKVAKKNQKWLHNLMTEQGFINYPLEWWHFSYGDQYWAAAKKEKYAIYDRIIRD